MFLLVDPGLNAGYAGKIKDIYRKIRMKRDFLYIYDFVRDHGTEATYDVKLLRIKSGSKEVSLSLLHDLADVKDYLLIDLRSDPGNEISGDVSKKQLLFGLRKVEIDMKDVEKACENLKNIRKCLENSDDEKPFVCPELKYNIQDSSMN